jgi:hypothetical protein
MKRSHQLIQGIIGIIGTAFRGNSTLGCLARAHWAAVTLPVLLLATAEPAVAKRISPAGDIVVRWNQELTATLDVAGLHPSRIRVERSYAMLHVAMFDAVNAIERGYSPFRFTVHASRGASSEAAAAQAAHDILLALYPAKGTNFQAILAETLADIPPGLARQGVAVGQQIAAQVLAWRENDGWDVPAFPPYVLPLIPGNWRPTPPGFAAAAFTQYPNVLPFAIASNTQFLVAAPPSLNSPEYTAAYNEVKAVGASNSVTRTADQTEAARVHASLGTTSTPPKLWNGIAQDVTLQGELGLLDAARLFALMNVSIHDALQTSFTGKYTYGLWRPVTAIREDDGNPNTVQDPNWTPLVNAPPYPTYPGNAAAYGAAGARSIAIALGTDNVPFVVRYPATPGNPQPPDIYRSYSGFWDLAEEMAQCRIWAGIHFTFDSAVSQAASVSLVDWVAERYMVPR